MEKTSKMKKWRLEICPNFGPGWSAKSEFVEVEAPSERAAILKECNRQDIESENRICRNAWEIK